SIAYLPWPQYDQSHLVEDTFEYPIQINGKLRDKIVLPLDATKEQIQAAALSSEKITPLLVGKTIKKVIIVPKKIVNIAIG
ncbi:MAG: hypothetical protein IKX46_03685, partial [Verrucomicrobia bacterium]|nr:hypothetical protein [Verrucomicrobiota bacterium]